MSAAKGNENKKSAAKVIVDNDATETSDTAAAKPTALQIPDWLKPDLFVDLLRKNIPNFKKIKNFSAKPSETAGENYSTLMALVEIEVELESGNTKQISYMLKLPIAEVMTTMKTHNIFEIETTMYRDVIPELEQLYADIEVDVKFAPQYYELETPSEYGVILMEDLRQRDFKNVNRLEGFTMEHTKAALKKVSQFHAASAVRMATKGKYPKIISTGIFTEEFIDLMKVMNDTSKILFNECVKTYKGHEVYAESLRNSKDRVFDEICSLLKTDPNDFNVLNHGDFWANNIMFQYDAFGKIKETYLVDFQCTRYGSPVSDLYNLILSSTQYEIKLKHFDYFIKYYYDNLIENLKLLKYTKKLPALKDIHIAMHKYGAWGLGVVCGHMSIVLVDPTATANLENLLGNTPDAKEFKRLMYTNERFRKHAEAVLPWLHNRGAFE